MNNIIANIVNTTPPVQHHLTGPAGELDSLIKAIEEPVLRMYATIGVRQLRKKLGRGKSWESMAALHRLGQLATCTISELTGLLGYSMQQEIERGELI